MSNSNWIVAKDPSQTRQSPYNPVCGKAKRTRQARPANPMLVSFSTPSSAYSPHSQRARALSLFIHQCCWGRSERSAGKLPHSAPAKIAKHKPRILPTARCFCRTIFALFLPYRSLSLSALLQHRPFLLRRPSSLIYRGLSLRQVLARVPPTSTFRVRITPLETGR